MNTDLPIQPQEATKILLTKLPTRRMRDVISKRFGLKGGREFTLEAIGKEYRITRERVRQIEADALKHLSKEENLIEVQPLLKFVHDYLKDHGEVMAEHHLFTNLVDSRQNPHLALLLSVVGPFKALADTDGYHKRWSINKDRVSLTDKILTGVAHDLELGKRTVTREELREILARNCSEVLGMVPPEQVTDSYLGFSKLIRQNPYGEYGLLNWSSISPRGVKDKSYVVLAKAARPLHFREVAKSIDAAGWSKKKAHPQTVHNELIKDSRFVLVGRGLYGLREWGYEPGVVRDILVSVLKKAARPLAKDEIVQLVLQKRFVKAPTVLLNLQNKSLFRRTDDGKFNLI